MGRAFEYRKATKLKRWGNMARVFTKFCRQITISVKEGGTNPNINPRLRVLIQQAKKENMPKENVERAIKKAFSKEMIKYKEIIYEGYGPYGIAFIIETITDNPTRTVANVRSYFNKYGGSLGTSGSLQFLFSRKCVFKITHKKEIDLEVLELKLIDFGINGVELDKEGNAILIYGEFQSYSVIQKYLEENDYEILYAEFEQIPKNYKEVTKEERILLEKLFLKFKEDEDVQNIFHNMK